MSDSYTRTANVTDNIRVSRQTHQPHGSEPTERMPDSYTRTANATDNKLLRSATSTYYVPCRLPADCMGVIQGVHCAQSVQFRLTATGDSCFDCLHRLVEAFVQGLIERRSETVRCSITGRRTAICYAARPSAVWAAQALRGIRFTPCQLRPGKGQGTMCA